MTTRPDPFHLMHDPNLSRHVYDEIEIQFSVFTPQYFAFLETEFGFSTQLTGQNIGIFYRASKGDFNLEINLDTYIVEAGFRYSGESELRLIREDVLTGTLLQWLEKCLNPSFSYYVGDWGKPGYVEKEIKVFSAIVRKNIGTFLWGDPVELMMKLTPCIQAIKPSTGKGLDAP